MTVTLTKGNIRAVSIVWITYGTPRLSSIEIKDYMKYVLNYMRCLYYYIMKT